MEQTQQHQQGNDQLPWLPDGELAIERVSPDIRDTLRDMARTAQDRPWVVAHAFGVRMRAMAASTTSGLEAADVVLRLHVTAFLELLGADRDRCDDPFQCGLYLTTLCRDFDRAATKYAHEHGGEKAITRMMLARLDDSGDRLDELPASAQKAKSPRPKDIAVRLAQNEDGARIGELARAFQRLRSRHDGTGRTAPIWRSPEPHDVRDPTTRAKFFAWSMRVLFIG